jgi:hypothetical protein
LNTFIAHLLGIGASDFIAAHGDLWSSLPPPATTPADRHGALDFRGLGV